jgi:GNAT superfamily N-acetyltransferase
VIVRERTEGDLDVCEAIARTVHEKDGYPVYLPGDLRSFLASSDALGAWVAEIGGSVVGHVALHRRSSDAVMKVATDFTELPADRFGVVARLLVAPEARRHGVGRALLRTAVESAASRGLRPMLDVVIQHGAAVHLYEEAGWIRAGETVVQFGKGNSVRELVFVGPP